MTTSFVNPVVRYYDAALPWGLEIIGEGAKNGIASTLRGNYADFLDTESLTKISDWLATAMATSYLIGRYRVFRHAQERAEQYASFNEPDMVVPWTPSDLVKFFFPRNALEYFRAIMPLELAEPLFSSIFEGRAFSLAVTTDSVIKRKVAEVVSDRLETGKQIRAAGRDVEEILEESGVAHPNGYGKMVVRTNMMESYRNGGWDQFNDPDTAEAFPAWQYIGIADGRERMGPEPEKPDHHCHFRKYWPRDVNFFDVRGRLARDVINCRCDFLGVYVKDWERLRKNGTRFETERFPY